MKKYLNPEAASNGSRTAFAANQFISSNFNPILPMLQHIRTSMNLAAFFVLRKSFFSFTSTFFQIYLLSVTSSSTHKLTHHKSHQFTKKNEIEQQFLRS